MKSSNIFFFLFFTFFTSTLFSQDVHSKLMHARELYASEKYTEALSVYSQLNNIYPKEFDVSFEIAQTAYRANRFLEAKRYYQNCIDLQKEDALISKAYFNLGNVNWKLNKKEEAVEAFKNSLRINPLDSKARFNLAKLKKELASNQQTELTGRQPKETDSPKSTSDIQLREEENYKSVLSKWKTEQILDQIIKAEIETKRKMAKKQKTSSTSNTDKDW